MLSRLFWLSTLAVGIAALVAAHNRPAAAKPTSPAQDVAADRSCVGVLDGSELPDLLPTFFVWEHLWADVADTPAPQHTPRLATGMADVLDERSLIVLRDVGGRAHQRASALREASIAPVLPTDAAADRDIVAAEAVLAGRDELIRSLPSDRYSIVNQRLQDGRREMKYRFPEGGRIHRDAIVGDLCVVTIKGIDYPHLIPEAYAWEFYFRIRALAASSERTGQDTYSEAHLATVQRSDIPIPTEHILHLLRVAAATNEAIDRLRSAASSGQAGPHEVVEEELAHLVLDARDDLVRSLPPKAWLAVQADLMRRMDGVVFDFPTRMQQ